jgi:hypothetical protein
MNLQGDGDMVDNVLMEYILMLALKSHAEGSVQAIYPLLMGSIQPDGAYSPFPMADLNMLPHTPSYKTCDGAARLMTMMRMPAELIDDMRQRSARNTVNMLLRHQECHIADLRGTSALTDLFAGKVLEMMMREIRVQQDAQNNFRLRQPCALEMLEWLHETSLQPLKEVFNASGLESLQVVATLSGSRLRELCLAFEETKPKEEVRFPEELFARFEIARDKLRGEGPLPFHDSASSSVRGQQGCGRRPCGRHRSGNSHTEPFLRGASLCLCPCAVCALLWHIFRG